MFGLILSYLCYIDRLSNLLFTTSSWHNTNMHKTQRLNCALWHTKEEYRIELSSATSGFISALFLTNELRLLCKLNATRVKVCEVAKINSSWITSKITQLFATFVHVEFLHVKFFFHQNAHIMHIQFHNYKICKLIRTCYNVT